MLAVGGDLHSGRLILAYQNGIFPWYSNDTPILWYSPHERFVLIPEKIKVSRSMKQFMKRPEVEIKINADFFSVIRHCRTIARKDQEGTWITDEMLQAYLKLHELGYAHSIETYIDGKLAGGLYGVLSGRVFCGESMFSIQPNASKSALIWLCQRADIDLVDCQIHSPHLESMGAEFISRTNFMEYLRR